MPGRARANAPNSPYGIGESRGKLALSGELALLCRPGDLEPDPLASVSAASPSGWPLLDQVEPPAALVGSAGRAAAGQPEGPGRRPRPTTDPGAPVRSRHLELPVAGTPGVSARRWPGPWPGSGPDVHPGRRGVRQRSSSRSKATARRARASRTRAGPRWSHLGDQQQGQVRPGRVHVPRGEGSRREAARLRDHDGSAGKDRRRDREGHQGRSGNQDRHVVVDVPGHGGLAPRRAGRDAVDARSASRSIATAWLGVVPVPSAGPRSVSPSCKARRGARGRVTFWLAVVGSRGCRAADAEQDRPCA